MASNDFFLNFGSNAGDFGKKITGEITPAVESIENLIAALERYDETVSYASSRKTASPLNTLFTQLDRAGEQYARLTGEFASVLQGAVKQLAESREELSAMIQELRAVGTYAESTRKTTSRGRAVSKAQRDPVAVAAITDEDVAATTKTVSNRRLAQNANRRVADISDTVAKNANRAADGLKNLGAQIRDLTKAAESSVRTMENIGADGGLARQIVIQGDITHTGQVVSSGNLVTTSGATHPVVPPKAVTDEEADFVARRIALQAAANVSTQRGLRPLPARLFSQPAVGGLYALNAEEIPDKETDREGFDRVAKTARPVGFDVRHVFDPKTGKDLGPNETFSQYFQRHDEYEEALRNLVGTKGAVPAASKEDLALLERFRKGGGRIDQAAFSRDISQTNRGDFLSAEQVRASFPSLTFGSLDARDIEKIPDTFARLNEVREQQKAAFSGVFEKILAKDPHATFQGRVYERAGLGNLDLGLVDSPHVAALSELDERIARGGASVPELESQKADLQRQLGDLGTQLADLKAQSRVAGQSPSDAKNLRGQIAELERQTHRLLEGKNEVDRQIAAGGGASQLDPAGVATRQAARDKAANANVRAIALERVQDTRRRAEAEVAKLTNQLAAAEAGQIPDLTKKLGAAKQRLEQATRREGGVLRQTGQTVRAENLAGGQTVTERLRQARANFERVGTQLSDATNEADIQRLSTEYALAQGNLDAAKKAASDEASARRKAAAERKKTVQAQLDKFSKAGEGSPVDALKLRQQRDLIESGRPGADRAAASVLGIEDSVEKVGVEDFAPGTEGHQRILRAQANVEEKARQIALQRHLATLSPTAPFEAGQAKVQAEINASKAAQAADDALGTREGGRQFVNFAPTIKALQAKLEKLTANAVEQQIQQQYKEALDTVKNLTTRSVAPTITDEQRQQALAKINEQLEAAGKAARADAPSRVEELNTTDRPKLFSRLLNLEPQVEKLGGLGVRNQGDQAYFETLSQDLKTTQSRLDRLDGIVDASDPRFHDQLAAYEDSTATTFQPLEDEPRFEDLSKKQQKQRIAAADKAQQEHNDQINSIKRDELTAERDRLAAVHEGTKSLRANLRAQIAETPDDPTLQGALAGTEGPFKERQRALAALNRRIKSLTPQVAAIEEKAVAPESAVDPVVVAEKEARSKALESLQAQRQVAQERLDSIKSQRAGIRGGTKYKALDDETRATFDQTTPALDATKASISSLNKQIHQLESAAKEADRQAQKEADRQNNVAAGGSGRRGGGGGKKPPAPPAAGTPGDDEEPSIQSKLNAQRLGQLQDETKAALEQAAAVAKITAKTKELTAVQKEALTQAALVYRQDPVIQELLSQNTRGSASLIKSTFSQGVGLPGGGKNNDFLQETFKLGGTVDNTLDIQKQARAAEEAARTGDVFAQAEALVAGESAKAAAAVLRLVEAEERLAALQTKEVKNPGSVSLGEASQALRSVDAAKSSLNQIRAEESQGQGGIIGQKLFGQQGFIDGQLRHFGRAIENIAGYTLVFTGFQQLKQLVDDGIQADAAFVRLQAALTATGRATGDLRSQLQGVSSATAQSLPAVVEAASELTGVFNDNASLVAATKVAAELANISQGTLTAKEAATGLRDVTDAYGITGAAAIQEVGDQIAHLSQITGVSVADIVEGTTQLAQEAQAFGLTNPRQAAVLSAYVTRSTGETGEAAAEQVSRILSSLNQGRVQTLLEKTQIPGTSGKTLATSEQFASGDIGGVLTSLLSNFDKLPASSKQAITALVGTGRQARAFAGLLRDAAAAGAELGSSENDLGALSVQNQKYLNSLAGSLKQLENDFRNVGATLQQAGFFNIIGLMAKALDELFRTFNTVFGGLARIANSNPFTKYLKDIIVLVGEAAFAMKLLGGTLGSAFGRFNPGRARIPVLNKAGGAVLSQETGEALTEFAPVTFRGVRNAEGELVTPGVFGTARALPGKTASGISGFFRGKPTGSILANSASEVEGQLALPLGGVVGGEVERSASGLSKLRSGIAGIGASTLATTGVMVGAAVAIGVLSDGFQNLSQQSKTLAGIMDELDGSAQKAAASTKNQTTLQTTAQAAATAAHNPSFSTRLAESAKSFFTGGDSNEVGDPSQIFSVLENKVLLTKSKQLRAAIATGDPKKVQAAIEQIDSSIQKQADGLVKTAGNKGQQTTAAYELTNLIQSLNNSAAKRIAALKGLNVIDQLTDSQAQTLAAVVSEVSSFTTETIRDFPGVIKEIEQVQAGIPLGGKASNALNDFLDGGRRTTNTPLRGKGAAAGADAGLVQGTTDIQTSYLKRQQDLVTISKAGIRAERYAIAGSGNPDNALAVGTDAYNKAKTAEDQFIQDLQTARQNKRTAAAQNPLLLEAIAEASGHVHQAVDDLRTSNAALTNANKKLESDDPAYLSNLQQIQQNKIKIAQLQAETAIEAANLAAASSNDPLTKANAALTAALAQQAAIAAEPGGGSRADRNNAAVQVATSRIARAQAQADSQEAQFQLAIAGHVANLADIQKQISDDVRQENLYASGTLKNTQQYLAFKKQEAADRLSLLQAEQAQANSETELKIAQLTARGKAGDLQDAARLQLQEAKQKLAQYLRQPGAQRGDAQANELQASIVQARRNAFDVALNAQLDTLDFQAQTYKITSEQEIQSLQEILKNKQLTLAEQRSITLKIKDLQTQIRQELIGSGFNIPSNIKLPTAYEVRRSLGGGFNGNSTTVENSNNTTNNNQRVTINQRISVPDAATADRVANHTVKKINESTSKSVRANSSTPRLVAVGS